MGIIVIIKSVKRSGRESDKKISIEPGSNLNECVINTKIIFWFNFQKAGVNMYLNILYKEVYIFVRDSVWQYVWIGIDVMAIYCCNVTLFLFREIYIKITILILIE